MPPFYNSNGFEDAPTTVLSLDAEKPLSTESGKLALKTGAGLSVNENGELQSTSAVPNVSAPLTNTNSNIGLGINTPLSVQNGKLDLKTGAGLSVNENGELQATASAPNVSAPLTSSNSNITLGYSEPLSVQNNKLTVSVGDGLNIYNGKLVVIPDTTELPPLPPLTKQTGRLGLNIANPFFVNNNTLRLNAGKSMQLNGGALDICNPKAPIQFQDNGALALGMQPPFNIYNGGLNLKLGAGLSIVDGALTVTAAATAATAKTAEADPNTEEKAAQTDAEMLDESANQIKQQPAVANEVESSAPFILSASPPLKYADNNLQLILSPQFKVQDDMLYINSDTNYTFMEPIINTDHGITLSFTQPFVLQEKMLSLSTAAPLSIGRTGLELSIGSGLVIKNNLLCSHTDTLWTTAEPSPNVSISSELSAKLWLTLTRCGDLVQGLVAIQGLKAPDDRITTETPKSVKLIFLENGALNVEQSSLKGAWGFKVNNSVDPKAVENALSLMPNQAVYPLTKGVEARSSIMTQTYLGSSSRPATLEVSCNSIVKKGFSLEFKWSVNTNYEDTSFSTLFSSFAYVPQV